MLKINHILNCLKWKEITQKRLVFGRTINVRKNYSVLQNSSDCLNFIASYQITPQTLCIFYCDFMSDNMVAHIREVKGHFCSVGII